ncbi:SCF ubiquitin ligase complex subunit [Tulasnella sp. 419]|nr:SCF ubiquitin ligase complex subunit [Tulasnella sp. 419]
MARYREPRQTPPDSSDEEDENEEMERSGFEDDASETPAEPHSPARWSNEFNFLSLADGDHRKRQQPPKAAIEGEHGPANFLPHEILLHIFRNVNAPRDLHACLLVSRAWCQCSVELLWHKPQFTNLAGILKFLNNLGRKDLIFTYAAFVRRLNFTLLGPDLNDQLFSRLVACVKLERLTLFGCNAISDAALAEVLRSCPNLVALDLTGVSETTDASIIVLADVARRLQGINLGNCKKVTDTGVVALATHCPNLRRIKLSGLESLTDASVSALADNCPLLLELDLYMCPRVTDESVRKLWINSSYLRELRLSLCHNLTERAFPVPPPNSSNGSSTAVATTNHPFPPFHRLDDAGLQPLVLPRIFDHLRMLDLTGCANLTDEAMEGIISNCPKIRNLVLAKCGCPLLTDMSVFELAALPKLRRVGLVRVPNLTDQAIYSIGEQQVSLERIHLSYCENITVQAISFLLMRLTKLTHLSLTGIPAFKKLEYQQYCRPAPTEFTPNQRAAFCVYSGRGVNELRKHLQNDMQAKQDSGSRGDADGSDDDPTITPEYGASNGEGELDLGDENGLYSMPGAMPVLPGNRAFRRGFITHRSRRTHHQASQTVGNWNGDHHSLAGPITSHRDHSPAPTPPTATPTPSNANLAAAPAPAPTPQVIHHHTHHHHYHHIVPPNAPIVLNGQPSRNSGIGYPTPQFHSQVAAQQQVAPLNTGSLPFPLTRTGAPSSVPGNGAMGSFVGNHIPPSQSAVLVTGRGGLPTYAYVPPPPPSATFPSNNSGPEMNGLPSYDQAPQQSYRVMQENGHWNQGIGTSPPVTHGPPTMFGGPNPGQIPSTFPPPQQTYPTSPILATASLGQSTSQYAPDFPSNNVPASGSRLWSFAPWTSGITPMANGTVSPSPSPSGSAAAFALGSSVNGSASGSPPPPTFAHQMRNGNSNVEAALERLALSSSDHRDESWMSTPQANPSSSRERELRALEESVANALSNTVPGGSRSASRGREKESETVSSNYEAPNGNVAGPSSTKRSGLSSFFMRNSVWGNSGSNHQDNGASGTGDSGEPSTSRVRIRNRARSRSNSGSPRR